MKNLINIFFLIFICSVSWKIEAAEQNLIKKISLCNNERIELLVGKQLNDDCTRIFFNNLQSQPEKSPYLEVGYYYSFKKDGLEFLFDKNDRIITIFINKRSNKYEQYQGPLPNRLLFTDSRADVHNKLGLAHRSGGGQKSIIGGKVPIWDKYYFTFYSLRIEYDIGGIIKLITLATPGSELNEEGDRTIG